MKFFVNSLLLVGSIEKKHEIAWGLGGVICDAGYESVKWRDLGGCRGLRLRELARSVLKT